MGAVWLSTDVSQDFRELAGKAARNSMQLQDMDLDVEKRVAADMLSSRTMPVWLPVVRSVALLACF